jgi:uncharacterized protein YecA (UPF0149 family)
MQEPPPDPPADDTQIKAAVREMLDLLPEDVVAELNRGEMDVHDPAFLGGLTDHVSRQSLADPRTGQRLLGKLIKLKKLIARNVRDWHPGAVVSATVTRGSQPVGRNAPCPCGSGKKFKLCCLRKR